MATPEHEQDYLNEERLADERRLWRAGLSKAEVHMRVRAEAARVSDADKARRIADWKAKYPKATKNEAVIWALIELQARFPHVYPGRQPERKP